MENKYLTNLKEETLDGIIWPSESISERKAIEIKVTYTLGRPTYKVVYTEDGKFIRSTESDNVDAILHEIEWLIGKNERVISLKRELEKNDGSRSYRS